MAEPGAMIGRYRVGAAIGAGAMGTVVRAHDDRLGREVAIKRIRNLHGVAAAIFNARFEAEARALAALAHPGVVAVFDLGVDDGEPYLVMELLPGPSLRELLSTRGALPPAEVAALGIQVARALEAAHARGILHRDVKPANLVRGGDGGWKLVDFGVAHTPDSDVTLAGQFVGTPSYAAPEALALGRFSPASDVFALAATLVEVATGTRPRADLTLAHLIATADAPLLDERGRAALGPLAVPLARALAVVPEERPSAGELATALAAAASGADQAEATTTATAPGATATDRAAITTDGGATAAAVVTPGPAPAWPVLPWRRIAKVAGGVVGFGLLVAIVTCDGDGERDRPARGRGAGATEERRFAAPPDLDARAARDWRKIAEEVHDGDLDKARTKLREFERKHGASDASRALGAWLDDVR